MDLTAATAVAKRAASIEFAHFMSKAILDMT
jgi:hypothetical protein